MAVDNNATEVYANAEDMIGKIASYMYGNKTLNPENRDKLEAAVNKIDDAIGDASSEDAPVLDMIMEATAEAYETLRDVAEQEVNNE